MQKNTIAINTTTDKVATTVTIAGKEFAIIPLELLNVENKWQRSLETAKAKRKIAMLVDGWDENQCRPITVIYNESTQKYDVIDGGHRVKAAELKELGSLVAEIIRLEGTQEEKDLVAAKLFAEQGKAVDKLTPAEKHKANVMLGIPANLTLEAAAKRVGFSLKSDGTRGKKSKVIAGYVCGFNAAYSLAKNSPDILNETFDVIKAIRWGEEEAGLSAATIVMISKAISYHLDHVEKFVAGIQTVLTNKKPKQIFAEAMAMYSGRNEVSRNLMYLEGLVCDELKIDRRFIDKNVA